MKSVVCCVNCGVRCSNKKRGGRRIAKGWMENYFNPVMFKYLKLFMIKNFIKNLIIE